MEGGNQQSTGNLKVRKRYISSNFEPRYKVIGGNLSRINSGTQSWDEGILNFMDSRPSVLTAYILLLQNHKRTSTSGTIERH